MSQDNTKDKAKERTKSSPGHLTHFVVYVVALTAMYFASTPEVTEHFTEGQERDFHVAAIKLIKDANGVEGPVYMAYSLQLLKSGKVDLASVSFLLPQDAVNVFPDSGDINKATVLERHSDWQLIEYQFGNSHDSISRYRAFKDRIEPVSYRMTMNVGLFLGAIVLLIPVWIVSAVINAVWKAVTGRRKSGDKA
jgi:hypothetical protein